MEAHAEAWDRMENEAECRARTEVGRSRPHLRAVDRRAEERFRGAASHDTEYWIAEARRVREEIDELVSALDAPYSRAPARPAQRSRAPSAAPRPRSPYEEPLDDAAYGEDEELEPADDDPFVVEMAEMRDELEYLRTCVASMSGAGARTPRMQRAPARRVGTEGQEKMKKLAMLMLFADLV